jgi:hypothetical protein
VKCGLGEPAPVNVRRSDRSHAALAIRSDHAPLSSISSFLRSPPDSGDPASSPPFVPTSVFDWTSIGQLEIELDNTCTVRLKGTVDPKLLRVAIHAAGRSMAMAEGLDLTRIGGFQVE